MRRARRVMLRPECIPGSRGERMATMLSDLRDPLGTLIVQGEVLVGRLRRLPTRRVAALSECTERLLLSLIRIDAELNEVVAAMSDRT
jgi:hypothetical protein